MDRFTKSAKQAIGCAVETAKELGLSYVGTEHLLLGLLEEGEGVAARELENHGVEEERLIELIQNLVDAGQESVSVLEPGGYTPRAKMALENSYREAVRMKSVLIGTEHILSLIHIWKWRCFARRIGSGRICDGQPSLCGVLQ